MKLFNLDSPVMVFLTKVGNLMILNILTLICCIPIITIGDAFTALYYVTIKMARGDDPYIVKSYFKSFKENFKQSTVIWIIMLAAIIILTMDFRIVFLGMQGTFSQVMKGILIVVSIFAAATALYVFPVLSRFENTVKNTIKNAFLISILNLPKTVLILLIHALPIACVLITLNAIPVVLLLGIPTVAYLSSIFFVKAFKRFEPEEEELPDGEELAPLSFIVEEEKAKQEAIAAQEAAEKAALGGTVEADVSAEAEESVEFAENDK